ncbi:MAG: hypothetical protein COA58_01315 [Bacteroidetes bacterium]|nr:MAG: hypothetical protein COA58_01315 [Bacteroidota bacterium]
MIATNDVITKEVVFNSKIDNVWNAISIGEEISKWFLKADFKPEVGYKYSFRSPNDDCEQIHGEVKEATPYKLVYTWIVAGTNVETKVSWELQSTDEGTQLYLKHSGIAEYDEDTAIKMFESFNGGWDNCISGLTDFL